MDNIPPDKRRSSQTDTSRPQQTSHEEDREHGRPSPDSTNQDGVGPSTSRIRVRDMRKTARRLATAHQLAYLESAFERSRTLTAFTQAERDELAERTNMTLRQIGHWFQNRRRAFARRSREAQDMQARDLRRPSHSASDSSGPPQERTGDPDYVTDMTRSSSTRAQTSPSPLPSLPFPIATDSESSSVSSPEQTASISHYGEDVIPSLSLRRQGIPTAPALPSVLLTSLPADLARRAPNQPPSTNWPRDPRFGPDPSSSMELRGRMPLEFPSVPLNPLYRLHPHPVPARVPSDTGVPQLQQWPAVPFLSDQDVYRSAPFGAQTDSNDGTALSTSGSGVELGHGLGSHPSGLRAGMGGMLLPTGHEGGFAQAEAQRGVTEGMSGGVGTGVDHFPDAGGSQRHPSAAAYYPANSWPDPNSRSTGGDDGVR